MNNVKDFLIAALPWVAVGLCLVIIIVRFTLRKGKKAQNGQAANDGNNYSMEGMCIGMCLGSAAGAIGIIDIGISISMGMLMGLCIGMCFEKKDDSN